MKTKSLLCIALGAILSMSACAKTKASSESAQPVDSKKVLVAYFSATGTTRHVAGQLAEIMGASVFEIQPETPYTDADLDWRDSSSRSSVEMHNPDFRPPIKNTPGDLSEYDTVFLGFPIWWYIAPTIINTFIENNDLTGKDVICFATSGGSPIEPCVDALKKQYPDINWRPGRLLNNVSESDLRVWKSDLGL